MPSRKGVVHVLLTIAVSCGALRMLVSDLSAQAATTQGPAVYPVLYRESSPDSQASERRSAQ
jgi:hypothetical protein